MMKNEKNKERLKPIPEIFYSSETNNMFSECTICNKELLDSEENYFIEKGIKNYPQANKTDVIFEYAICESCMDEMRKHLSEESMARIAGYMIHNVDFESRYNNLMIDGEKDIDEWLSNCIVKNTGKNTMQEYQVMCQCNGRDAVFSFFPYIIGDVALEEVQNLLSKKTKEELDRFYNTFLGPSPEMKELFKSKVLII